MDVRDRLANAVRGQYAPDSADAAFRRALALALDAAPALMHLMARLALQVLLAPSRSTRARRMAANFVIATLLEEGRWSDAERELAELRRQFPDDAALAMWPAAAAALGFRVNAPGHAVAEQPDLARAPFAAFASGWLSRYQSGAPGAATWRHERGAGGLRGAGPGSVGGRWSGARPGVVVAG
ncbi:MAG TPA: hypothetical protein VNL98_01585 [Gemmatimonadales bacterium]|nr:hypothetical protein [Gemmatimonadales bacterium]